MLCATLNAFRKWTGEPTSKQMSVELEMKIELREMRTLILFQFVCVCAAIAVLIFFLKCTSTFHAAFTCPIQMITSKESSVCFFTLLLFLSSIYSIHSFIHIRYCVPAWTRPFPRFHVINYALSCLAIVVISENKMRFQIRLSTIRRQRQNQINGEK